MAGVFPDDISILPLEVTEHGPDSGDVEAVTDPPPPVRIQWFGWTLLLHVDCLLARLAFYIVAHMVNTVTCRMCMAGFVTTGLTSNFVLMYSWVRVTHRPNFGLIWILGLVGQNQCYITMVAHFVININ
jgi:hypothetical protein